MGFYYIRQKNDASKLCMIILMWWEYLYKILFIGISISPDIDQKKRNDLFQGLKFIHVHIDDLFILTKGYWKFCLSKLDITLY